MQIRTPPMSVSRVPPRSCTCRSHSTVLMGRQALETLTPACGPSGVKGCSHRSDQEWSGSYSFGSLCVTAAPFSSVWLNLSSCSAQRIDRGNRGTLCSRGSVRAPSRRVCLFAQGWQPTEGDRGGEGAFSYLTLALF